jgi:hypothetical protein
MPYSPHNQSSLIIQPSLARLPSFLEEVKEAHDLLRLLDRTILVNPSDLFAIVDCETRLRGYSGDRTVSAAMFFIDLRQEISFRLDTSECDEQLQSYFSEIVCAIINHYQRPSANRERASEVIRKVASIGCRELIHESFERRYQDWRQMIRTARRTKQSLIPEHSAEYGLLNRGVVVADRIGNMLSHVRHMYCDQSFPSDVFTVA